MKIAIKTRFSDVATFLILFVIVCLSFIASLYLYTSEFIRSEEFWLSASTCVAAQDFACLYSLMVDKAMHRDILLSVAGAALSVQGAIFGVLVVMLYKEIAVYRLDCSEQKKK